MSGPLHGLRVVEFAGLGPVPFACMLLSDMGADVVTIDRPDRQFDDPHSVVGRGRTVLGIDLKSPGGREQALALTDRADVLVEGFRPGVMERLELGPEPAMARNPRLVYGRLTGWGQTGELSATAGHDINYISIVGALAAMGTAGGPPLIPLNLVGDYAGGSLYMVCGILAALHERHVSGRGQVIDAAIVDGSLSLMSLFVGHVARGSHRDNARGANMLDGGAPFYALYETSDGRFMSAGALEPAFFALLCKKLDMPADLTSSQFDRKCWPAMRAEFACRFGSRTQAEWIAVFGGSDACVAPVLSLTEARLDPHLASRQAFVDVGSSKQPAPAPRFSRTVSEVQSAAPTALGSSSDVLERWSR